jgi:hypothetical protein
MLMSMMIAIYKVLDDPLICIFSERHCINCTDEEIIGYPFVLVPIVFASVTERTEKGLPDG